MSELRPVIAAPLTSDGERLLLDVLHYRGQLRLTRTADLPHSLSPEEMLKSLALQALGRWTGLTYLTEMQRLVITTSSSRLKSTVKAVIQKAQATHRQELEADAISEEAPAVDEAGEETMWPGLPYPLPSPRPTPSGPQRRFVARPISRFGTLTNISGERSRKSRREEQLELVS